MLGWMTLVSVSDEVFPFIEDRNLWVTIGQRSFNLGGKARGLGLVAFAFERSRKWKLRDVGSALVESILLGF